MPKLPIYQVDAFTDRVFGGNPAAVCPLEEWLPAATMQAIAQENNLSETVFFVRDGDGYRIRWFTPQVEVDLCGHATLAAAFVVFRYLERDATQVVFASDHGPLIVKRSDDRFCMDFPSLPPRPCALPPALVEAMGSYPAQVLEARSFLLVYRSSAEVADLRPDMAQLVALDAKVIATAPGDDVDFVSRFFAPSAGIPEDPVTGSAHCTLTPYWAARTGKTTLRARQISPRMGEIECELRGDRVLLTGAAMLYLEGTITI